MGFNCGIVGLPNVGKSTLFNALTQTASAQAANFPFCTIEPNVGRVGVPDDRLERLAGIQNSKSVIPTQLEFVDIAGLVRGASKGEGLGNQFLANIRETDAILYVLRCFENDDITHVEGSVDPIRDAEVIETELMLADLESVEKRIANIYKRAQTGDKDAKIQHELLQILKSTLDEGQPARMADLTPEQTRDAKRLQLLTTKPVLYICNVDEDSAADGNDYTARVAKMAEEKGANWVIICASIEEEIAQLDDADEKAEFLESIGLDEPGLDRVIRAGYQLLDLITFFTCGPKEARAWTVRKGSTAPQAAGVIHTDFQKGFIRAETISYADYDAHGSEQAVKEAGRMRLEGKDYVVSDGDVFLFRFNV
ncbi:MAG: redox-regulated ATPase YchF [Alphaproteobacteria bacterium]